jgi:hypothetical protein
MIEEETMKTRLIAVIFALLWLASCATQTVNEKGKGNMRIVSATYGLNCGAPRGNVTTQLADFCNDTAICEYTIDVNKIGDPRRGCPKDYQAEYRCGGFVLSRSASVPAEASGKVVRLQCFGIF